MNTCTEQDCGRPVRCKGVCELHYGRLKAKRRHKPCACGCGELTAYTFKWGHHTRLFTNAEQSRRARFNDGSTQRDRGTGNSYRKVRGRHEHRRVMEKALGRKLRSDEIVHHKDENKRNNDLDNLQLVTRAEHARIHFHG